MGFVRDFGLLQLDHTPCGKPLTTTQAHALAQIADLDAVELLAATAHRYRTRANEPSSP